MLLPVLLVDLVVVGALADGRVEGKGLVQVAGLWGAQADKSRLKRHWSITCEWTSFQLHPLLILPSRCEQSKREMQFSQLWRRRSSLEDRDKLSFSMRSASFYLVVQFGSWICFQTWSSFKLSEPKLCTTPKLRSCDLLDSSGLMI